MRETRRMKRPWALAVLPLALAACTSNGTIQEGPASPAVTPAAIERIQAPPGASVPLDVAARALWSDALETVLAGDWSGLYDLVADADKSGCSRSTFVAKMIGVWLVASAFGAEELMQAQLQDLRAGALSLECAKVSENRAVCTIGSPDETGSLSIIREDGQWRLGGEPLGEDCEALDGVWEIGNGR